MGAAGPGTQLNVYMAARAGAAVSGEVSAVLGLPGSLNSLIHSLSELRSCCSVPGFIPGLGHYSEQDGGISALRELNSGGVDRQCAKINVSSS